jgi:hypothetical protein
MKPYWLRVRKVLEVLGYLVKRADPDGMELHFTNSGETCTNRNREKLLSLFDKIKLRDQCSPSRALSDILKKCTKRSIASVLGLEDTILDISIINGVNIYVLTDGVWDG